MVTWLVGLSVLLFGIISARVAYTSGFHDGALWASEGEGYPSKPPASWWGWRGLRGRIGRPHPPEEE